MSCLGCSVILEVSSSGGENYSPKLLYCPLRGPWMDTFSSWLMRWQRTPCSLKTLLLFLSISTDVIDVPGASRWVVGVFSGFRFSLVSQVGKLTTWEPSTARVHVHIQESLVREILTVSAAGQGWYQAELLILKMCYLEARERSEVCVTFSPLEIWCIKYLPVSWYR